MKRSESAISLKRAVTVPVLVKVLEKAKGSLDPTTALTARQIVLGALQDPDESLRAFTVNALGTYGGKDMVTALRKVAETDPSPEVGGVQLERRLPKRLPRFRNELLGKVSLKFTPSGKPQGAGAGSFWTHLATVDRECAGHTNLSIPGKF